MTDIYEPAEDSLLLAHALENFISGKRFKRTLEIGIGSGIQSQIVAPHSKEHVGVDINPHAVEYVKKLLPNAEIKVSDLFEKVTGVFDLIVFNAPYLPATRNDAPGWITTATVGGKKGYETILRFIEGLDSHLSLDGSCFLLFSSYSKPKIILTRLAELLYSYKLIVEQKIFMEHLYVYEIKKNDIRKALEKKKHHKH